MPRKVNYGIDHDDDFDTNYDYDEDPWGEEEDDNNHHHHYNYNSDVQHDEDKINIKEAVSKPGVWRCSICTFDNDESLYACDICGVFRDPVVNVSRNGNKGAADDLSKYPGVSMLAKSLFAPLPRSKPRTDAMFRQQSDGFASQDAFKFNKIGNTLGNNYDLDKALTLSYEKFEESTSSRVSLNNAEKKEKAKVPPSINGSEGSSEQMPNFEQRSASKSQCSLVTVTVTEDKPQNLTSAFNRVDVNEYTSESKINAKKSLLRSEYMPENWMLTDQEGLLTQLNIAIVGHVDSGKSTLTGRLLNLLGRISQKEMHKYEKEAKLQGKGSFAYAWALDESAEERERGITMTVAVAYFYTNKYHVVVLDSPGHKDFVPNMISGATQADAAILVVDASVGAFESGMDGNGSGGQTREHAQLIRSFGVDQIIVAVNKMDTVKYSKERFDSIKSTLGTFLHSCGFKGSLLTWVPLSAMENQNLVTAASDSRLSSWYQGPYLLDAIDSLQVPVRDVSKPLIMPICDVIKSHSFGQVAANGKLEAGALRGGLKVLLMPSGDVAMVRSLERDSKACSVARAGDNVSVYLQGIDGSGVMAGGVLCHPDFPVAVATHLELKVFMLDAALPILVGSQVEFHIHHTKEAARVAKIMSLLDPKTGKVSKRSPRCLIAKQSATIEVILDGAVCVEVFSNCRALGRVFLRASGRTIAVGIVTRIVES